MEKHYSIDPGKGTKMDGCPYSVFEDGHDVEDYIVPPKGYMFVGFKFEPLRNNQIYEGKLVAQYEKSSIKERITTNIWKILIPIIIMAVLGLIVLLLVSVFKNQNPAKTEPKKPKTETIVTPVDTTSTPQISETTTPSNGVVQEDTSVIPDRTETIKQQEETATIEETQERPSEMPQPKAEDPNVQFKQKFWTLIHDRVYKMDSYHDLYIDSKGKVECEEFEYLRFTILKDYASFKEWHGKLMKLPENQLQSIESIENLKNIIE